jgi:methionyl-tRNA formyltransferase
MEGGLRYGATCHQMDEYIDHGPILYVERFDTHQDDTSMTLLQKSLHRLFSMMERIFYLLLHEHQTPLPQGEQWGDRMFTEKKFNSLCQLSSSMTKDAFEQRYHSLQKDVENKNLVLHFHGHTFRYEGPVTADIVDLFATSEDVHNASSPKENDATILQNVG